MPRLHREADLAVRLLEGIVHSTHATCRLRPPSAEERMTKKPSVGSWIDGEPEEGHLDRILRFHCDKMTPAMIVAWFAGTRGPDARSLHQ